jgi:hypothetical protein
MKWITRRNARVDRIACPWLISRFIDPQAEFLFVEPGDVDRLAAELGATPFDVAGARLGHLSGRCSFESILVEYSLDDPALALLGRIVHGADIPSDVGIEPEAAGLRAIAEGFALQLGAADRLKLDLERPMYDALYEWCRQRAGVGA